MTDRWYLIAIILAYLAAGAVLAFACIVLLDAANQIHDADLCRRI
jgi:hypothetical protein